jgi:hypothetical protein
VWQALCRLVTAALNLLLVMHEVLHI